MAHDNHTIKREEVRVGEADAILERALKQPGVREMMFVYRQWELLTRETQPYCQIAARKKIIATADTSDRTVLRTM